MHRPVVFAWLCQLRVAPYSYDLLDNTGRRSPRTRSAEFTDLAVGQPFVRIFGLTYVFELAAFETNEHITLRPRQGSAMSRFAEVSNTYSVRPVGDGTRLHVRVLFKGPWFVGQTLALVNLLMMRKQLRVLKCSPNATRALVLGISTLPQRRLRQPPIRRTQLAGLAGQRPFRPTSVAIGANGRPCETAWRSQRIRQFPDITRLRSRYAHPRAAWPAR